MAGREPRRQESLLGRLSSALGLSPETTETVIATGTAVLGAAAAVGVAAYAMSSKSEDKKNSEGEGQRNGDGFVNGCYRGKVAGWIIFVSAPYRIYSISFCHLQMLLV